MHRVAEGVREKSGFAPGAWCEVAPTGRYEMVQDYVVRSFLDNETARR
jgi:hypothetical protein